MEKFSAGAIGLMRAIKERYPDVEMGFMVDPYTSAVNSVLDASLIAGNEPEYHAGYHAALDELLDTEVLKHNPGYDRRYAHVVNHSQHYELTSKGVQAINSVVGE